MQHDLQYRYVKGGSDTLLKVLTDLFGYASGGGRAHRVHGGEGGAGGGAGAASAASAGTA